MRSRLPSWRITLLKWLVAIPFHKYYFSCLECNANMIHIDYMESHERIYHTKKLGSSIT